jgi:hypothetical protein
MLHVKITPFFYGLIVLAIFSSCNFESKITVTRLAKKTANATIAGPKLINTSINSSSKQITLNGSNLAGVTQVRVTRPSGFDELYDIDSKSDAQLLISAKSNLTMLANELYNIVLSTADGDTAFQTIFSLGHMGATNGDVLQFDGTNWNPIPLPLSGISLQGTWDATGTTTSDAKDLQDGGYAVAAAPASGDYFVVAISGTTSIDGEATWNAGDWIIFNGTAWDRINNTTGVSSFNGRSGGVNPTSGDYVWSEIANAGGSYIDYYPNNVQCSDDDVLKYNSAVNGWECGTDDDTTSTGDITDVIAGTGLIGGAATGAATLNVDVGIGINKIVQLDGAGILPAVDGSAVTNLTPTNLSAAVPISLGGTGATTDSDARTALGLGTSAVADIGTAAGEVMGADGVPNCLSTEKLQMSLGPTFAWTCVADVNTGSTTFVALTDGPGAFATNSLKVVRVNSGETALEYFTLLDTNTSLGASDAVAPTQNAVKTYVDSAVAAAGSSDTLIDADSDTQIQVEEAADDDTIRFDTAGSERMVISNNGNVGININNPSKRLHIVEAAGSLPADLAASATSLVIQHNDGVGRTAGMALIGGGTSGRSSIYFGDSATFNDGVFSYAHLNRQFEWETAGTQKMSLSSAGDLSILAQGDLRFADGDSSNFVAFQAPTTVAGNVTWTLPAADGTNGQILSTNGSGVLAWATGAAGSDDLGDHTATTNINLDGNFLSGDGGSEGIAIDADGDVGIGSTSAAGKLYVYTTGANGIVLGEDQGNTSSSGRLFFLASSGNMLIMNENNNLSFRSGADVESASGTSRMYLSGASGNLKIGAGAANERLEVDGNIKAMAEGEIRLADNNSSNFVAFKAPATVASDVTWTLPAADGTNGQILSTNGSGLLAWAAATTGADDLGDHEATQNIDLNTFKLVGNSGTTGIEISAAGNVGIGSATPATKLDVVGDIQVNSASDICIATGNCLSNMSAALTNTQVEGFIADDVTTNFIPYDNGTKLVSSGLFWDDGNSHLSLGHSSPINNLSVADASSITGNMFTQNEQFPLEIRNTDATVGNFASIIFRGGANTSGAAAIGTQFQNQTSGSITGDIVMATNNSGTFSEKFRIKGDGNVGIGTSTPDELLDIENGNIKLTDTTDTARKIVLQRNSIDRGKISTDNSLLNISAMNNSDVNIFDDAGNGIVLKDGGNVGIGTSTPDEKLEVAGQVKITGGSPGVGKVLTSDADGVASWQAASVSTTLALKTSDYTVLTSDNNSVITVTGVTTITLPAAATAGSGFAITVKRLDGSSETTIATNSSETIDGSDEAVLKSIYTFVKLVSDGSDWHIIGQNGTVGAGFCPSGFVRVPANAGLGVASDFCVMKYEAKGSSGSVVSSASGNIYINIDADDAYTECSNITQSGYAGTFAMISNPEWMTIARNAEGIDANWSGGTVGSGCMFRGNDSGGSACGYDGANPETGTGRDSKASLSLSNGSVVYDLAGNVWEWVDWDGSGDSVFTTKNVTTGECDNGAWHEFNTSCSDLSDNEYKPAGSYTSTNGVGLWIGNVDTNSSTLRGGYYSDGTAAGAFTIGLNNVNSPGATIGFRCVWRP